MDARLACQTEVTPDARELYGLALVGCDDCRFASETRGLAVAPMMDDDSDDLVSLAQAALALGQRAEARATPPRPALRDRTTGQ